MRKSQRSSVRTSRGAFQSRQQGPRLVSWANDEQRAGFEYGPSPLLLTGGYGAGKTVCAIYKILAISDLFPFNRGVIVRRQYEQLKLTTRPSFFKVCPPEAYSFGGHRADSERYLRLNNGSEILWLYLDHPSSAEILGGLEINWFFLNQAEEIDEEIFDKLMGRLGRWDKTEVPPALIEQERAAGRDWAWWLKDPATGERMKPLPPTYPILDCNPDTEFHWLYQRFNLESTDHWLKERRNPLDPEGPRVSYHDLGYHEIVMESTKNKFLPDQNKAQLLQGSDDFVHRFVKGKWGIPSGTIHQVSALSVIEGSPEILEWVRRNCTLHRVLDHGDSAPTCCLWYGVDDAGNIIFYREYYMPNKLITDHRANITALSEGERYSTNMADPQIFLKTMQREGRRFSVADEYEDSVTYSKKTALFWQKGDNDELGTRNRISEYLKLDPERIYPNIGTHGGTKGAPRLFFIKRNDTYPQGCDNALRELRAQRRVKIGSSLGEARYSDERDDKIPDHAYDCIRYGMANKPPVAPRSRIRKLGVTVDQLRAGMKRYHRRGGFEHDADAVRELLRRHK